ncbi:hypothetical protein CIB84_008224 [Bambusicola thoracicus]|uniref:Uncharacterized protein n=1 Tax=Bambusicola thoracicus TaxID=9083 RepID=A0A2P4SVC4_BAMTH|nr:hypothetical protein CIB84_008224 [Bambusicola thoracicus]
MLSWLHPLYMFSTPRTLFLPLSFTPSLLPQIKTAYLTVSSRIACSYMGYLKELLDNFIQFGPSADVISVTRISSVLKKYFSFSPFISVGYKKIVISKS